MCSELQMSVQTARFWKDPTLTLRRFFTFPNPINEVEARLHSMCVSCLVVIGIVIDWQFGSPVLFWWILYGFMARVSSGTLCSAQCLVSCLCASGVAVSLGALLLCCSGFVV